MRYPLYPDYTFDVEDNRYYTTLVYFIPNGLFTDVIGLNKSSLPFETLESFLESCNKLIKNTPIHSLRVDGILLEYGQTDINYLLDKYKYRVRKCEK